MRRRIRDSSRSPAIVVAMLALVAAVAGTAVAGNPGATNSVSKKKTKQIVQKQVNKLAPEIANQQITARAPGLTVGNSDRLDDLDSSELSPGSFVDSGTNFTLGSTGQPILSATITTRTGGTLLAAASVEMGGDGGNDDSGSCSIQIDGTEGFRYREDIPDTPGDEVVLAVAGGASVGAGTHLVELLCAGSGTVSTDEQAMTVSAHL